MRRETREHSLFPTHETQDDKGLNDYATVADQGVSNSSQMPREETSKSSVILFGVAIGTAMQNR